MPTTPDPAASGGGGSPEDALRRLEERLDRASEAAERLMAQAAAEAAGGGSGNPPDPPEPPPAGWQMPDDSPPGSDLDPLTTLVRTLRELIPPELQRRLIAALRELLMALRALIDWYLERLEHRRAQPVEVEDIPIL
jgi:hypothetical protein